MDVDSAAEDIHKNKEDAWESIAVSLQEFHMSMHADVGSARNHSPGTPASMKQSSISTFPSASTGSVSRLKTSAQCSSVEREPAPLHWKHSSPFWITEIWKLSLWFLRVACRRDLGFWKQFWDLTGTDIGKTLDEPCTMKTWTRSGPRMGQSSCCIRYFSVRSYRMSCFPDSISGQTLHLRPLQISIAMSSTFGLWTSIELGPSYLMGEY